MAESHTPAHPSGSHEHHHHGAHFRFCPKCGGTLSRQVLKPNEPKRLVCGSCSFIFYDDPKVAACTIPVIQGKILLLQRGIEPGYGKWVFPGGFLDRGERVEDAAIRETWKKPVSQWRWGVCSMPTPTPAIRSLCWCIRRPCSPASPRPWTKRWPSSSLPRPISLVGAGVSQHGGRADRVSRTCREATPGLTPAQLFYRGFLLGCRKFFRRT